MNFIGKIALVVLTWYSAKGFSLSIKMSSMDYVNLGSSELKVSKVCLGTMTWGEQNTEDDGIAQLNTAFGSYGINFLVGSYIS